MSEHYDDSSLSSDKDESGKNSEKSQRNAFVRCICNNRFMITIIAGVIIGFAIGFGLRELPHISDTLKIWICKFGYLVRK